jgi:glycosyltransferase involved in cell wall biosynthesis
VRILQLCQRPQRRGAEIFARQLAGELRRRGQEVAIAYLYPHPGPAALELGPDDRVLGGDEGHPMETAVGIRPALLGRVRAVMKEFRPDVVQVNGARTVKYGVAARELLRVAPRAVVYRNIGAPADWIRGHRRKVFYRVILARVDGVVAISRMSLGALEPAFADRVPRTVISNGIDPDELRPQVARDRVRAGTGTPASATVVAFAGSLTHEKRVDRLVEAVARARAEGAGGGDGSPDLHLWILGDGPLRANLETLAARAGLAGAARFLGARSEVASFLAAADILALASDTEGIPGVVLEAGWLGLPVVAPRVGGIPECVADGETGILVEPGDADALARGLALLAGMPGLRARLGSAARIRVGERHTIGHIAESYLDFYRRVVGPEGVP